MISPLVLLVLLLLFMPQHFAHPGTSDSENAIEVPTRVPRESNAGVTSEAATAAKVAVSDELEMIDYALSLVGTPYVWAGETPKGFDCSGFITHVYDKYDVQLPHSSRMQAEEGEYVSRHEARPGDLLIFTGTNSQVREPGHVGIVISQPGDTIEFVHSSSNGGVKISQVEGSGYDQRFLQVRRVL